MFGEPVAELVAPCVEGLDVGDVCGDREVEFNRERGLLFVKEGGGARAGGE